MKLSTDNRLKKLTAADVGEIRLRASLPNAVKAALAREYGVSAQTIDYHTLHGKALKNGFADALESAANARRKGKTDEAARFLRAAADILESTPAKQAA